MEKHNRLGHVTILKPIKIYLRFEVHDTLTQYILLGRSAAVWLRLNTHVPQICYIKKILSKLKAHTFIFPYT
jgi:hypothetical protein